MKDSNWDLISGQDAHDIEVLNYSNQVNVIEALFKLMMYHHQDQSGACKGYPNQHALKELHHTGTLFLLNDAGNYRSVEVSVYKNGVVVYQPPPAKDVDRYMNEFEIELGAHWKNGHPIYIASFCLWKLNWIHPFKNGNGRSARAFSYACLCLKYGFMLPGSPTVIDLIMADSTPYQAALEVADKSFELTGQPDLSAMQSYLSDLLTKQLSSIA